MGRYARQIGDSVQAIAEDMEDKELGALLGGPRTSVVSSHWQERWAGHLGP